MKGSMNNKPTGPGLHAGAKKTTKSNLKAMKAKHKPMKVCASKKKNKVSDEQGLTKNMEGLTNDVEILNERVRILEEELKNKDAETEWLLQRLMGYVNSPLIKTPNVYEVPLKEEDHKSWLEFKKLDKERLLPDRGLSMGQLKWPISVDHPFVIVIRDFATEAFNEVIHMYAKKDESKILSHSQVMSCAYTKDYYFHMTMEAIEEGLLGVYEVIVACDHIDGSLSLVNLKLTDCKPTGKIAMYLISLKSEYKTMKGVEKDLRTKLEKTRKSIKGKKNKDKVAAELTRQLKIKHKAIKEKCKTLSQQIGSKVSESRNKRTTNQCTLCVPNKYTTGLFPRGAFPGGYNYYTRSMDFGLYVPMK